MATLGELKDRIVRECNREDLTDAPSGDPTSVNTDVLQRVIQRAIEEYADKRFFFNESRGVTAAVAGNGFVSLPPGLRMLDMLSVTIGGNRYPLVMRQYDEIERWSGYGPANGQPTSFAISNDTAQLYPVPNQSYPLTWLGIFDLVLDYEDDASSNAWTTYGEDLIAAQAVFLLQRDYFRDGEAAAIAQSAADTALTNLRGKSNGLISPGRIRASW